MTDPTDFNTLLAEARKQFEIRQEQIQFGDHSIDYYRPADPEAVMDEETLLSPHDELQWQPYWAQAWDAAVGICHYLAVQPLQGQRVLDLGCGIGLTSALLLAAGAHVVCGDNAPPSLLFARVNTWPWRDRVNVKLVDWHRTKLDQQFQIIVGSDIVYDRDEVPPLNRFLRKHLQSGGRVILSDPSRPMTREFLKMFRDCGWHLREDFVAVDGLRNPTRIVTLQLP